MSTAPPRHIQNDLSNLTRQEPADKDSIEHKDWELAYLKLQLKRSRLTVRIVRDGKNKQIAEMERKSASSIESLQQSMKHEMDQIERKRIEQQTHDTSEIEKWKQLSNHYKDMAFFHQVAKNGDAVVEELNIQIDELEAHIDHQSGIIQELQDSIAELQAKNLQSTSDTSNTSQMDKDKANFLMRENQEQQFKIYAQDSKILKLETTIADYVQKEKMLTEDRNQREMALMEQLNSITSNYTKLDSDHRKLLQQVGSTAKPVLKSKAVYQRKPNLTQKSLNTMFYDQATSSAASSPASTQSAPSPTVSAKRTAPITADEPNKNTSKIPLKRRLSATLSDKTNSSSNVLIRDSKEKGPAVEVKQEQVDIDIASVIENVPDQATHTTVNTAAIRKKPKNSTPVTAASTSTVRRVAQSKSAPGTPTSFITCNSNHRRDRSNMIGGTCTACVNFYGTETITANIDGQQLELTGKDRIQQNSRHRQHRNQRSNTPPGFWDLDFQTPERPSF
ncbi:unnamed protein product [Mucor fragilis]